ncbi:ARCA-like protein [Niveomyces insectorum RCEF 264]|uniref:ARCA-like protein n=1 Tax=Niveomyces insectorum RCEF 264 TaxID=1081102 RepID=A0A167LX06_9HYPO|nr:ARCA-like protein [Niveomyces insectorum RCEF 264]
MFSYCQPSLFAAPGPGTLPPAASPAPPPLAAEPEKTLAYRMLSGALVQPSAAMLSIFFRAGFTAADAERNRPHLGRRISSYDGLPHLSRARNAGNAGQNKDSLFVVLTLDGLPRAGGDTFVLGSDGAVCDVVLGAPGRHQQHVGAHHLRFGVDHWGRVVMDDVSSVGTTVAYDHQQAQRRRGTPGRPYRWVLPPDYRITVQIAPYEFVVRVDDHTDHDIAFHASLERFRAACHARTQQQQQHQQQQQLLSGISFDHSLPGTPVSGVSGLVTNGDDVPVNDDLTKAMYVEGRVIGRGRNGNVPEFFNVRNWTRYAGKRAKRDVDVLREAGLLRKLSHPRIVQYVDTVWEPPANHVLLMEHCGADTLWHQHRRQLLNSVEMLLVLQQMLDALAYLHKQGIVHCDIMRAAVGGRVPRVGGGQPRRERPRGAAVARPPGLPSHGRRRRRRHRGGGFREVCPKTAASSTSNVTAAHRPVVAVWPQAKRANEATDSVSKPRRWLKTPKRLQFVADSVDGVDGDSLFGEEEDEDVDGRASPAREQASPGERQTLRSGRPLHTTQTPAAVTGSTAAPANEPQQQQQHLDGLLAPDRLQLAAAAPGRAAHSPTDRFIVHDDFLEPAPSLHLSAAPGHAPSPRMYSERSVYPLHNKQEAMLLRHFVQKLAIWLDLCEPTQQFGILVPQRAATCSVLRNAMLALAAKHLAHVSDFARYVSDHYHQECLRVLIPLLSHEATAADENLFAATIILRVWEEMEYKHTGFDPHSYLLGIHAFVHGHGPGLVPNSLGAASFWVGLRQELYTATVNQQPVKAPLVPALVDGARALGPAADHDWANRAVVHCVDVLNFCFGGGGGDRNDRPRGNVSQPQPQPQPAPLPLLRRSWHDLSAWHERWTELLPPSYTPLLHRARGPGEAFPEIWYHSSWHVTGVQHHILAELFLVSFDPTIPRVGGQRLEAAQRVDDRIRELVRRICGIGLCNQWTPPGLFAACMAITAFGDRFHDRSDQEACLAILRRTEKDHARPTEAVQQQLMRSWDWVENG